MKPKPKPGLHKTYLELIHQFPLESIRSASHLKNAIGAMDSLFARGSLDEGGEAYLEALSDLIEVYESAHLSIEPASQAKVLEHLLEAKGVTKAGAARDNDMPRSIFTDVLAGRRRLSQEHIKTLAAYFRINPGVFLQEPGKRGRRSA